jgi:hypothetical protein
MTDKNFDPKKLQKLNNPQSLADIMPDYISSKLNTAKSAVMGEIGPDDLNKASANTFWSAKPSANRFATD